MNDALLAYLQQQGVGAWAVLVIGAGAVIAAVITAANSLIVATINVTAARRLAADAAHRAHREQLAQTSLEFVRAITRVSRELLMENDIPMLPEHVQQKATYWFDRFRDVTASERTMMFAGTSPLLHRSLGQFSGYFTDLMDKLSRAAAAEELHTSSREWRIIKDYALALEHIRVTIEVAAEAYVYGVRHLGRLVEKRLRQDPVSVVLSERGRAYYGLSGPRDWWKTWRGLE